MNLQDKEILKQGIEERPIKSIIPYINNPRTHSDEQITQIAASIREWGWTMPVLIDEKNTIIAGHGRYEAAKKMGYENIPVLVAKNWPEAKKKAYVIADNKLSTNAGWDNDLLKLEIATLSELEFDLPLIGFNDDELAALTEPDRLTKDDYYQQKENGILTKQFLAPPFSVFDARQGYWQKQKQIWKKRGIMSTKGRDDNLIGYGKEVHITGATDTSEFDPVLTEIFYRWLVPPGGVVLDPFAGGSVRGLVAAFTGRNYTGVDLSTKQIEENQKQAALHNFENPPVWLAGDSHKITTICQNVAADFLLSCPPYHDLEKYSNDKSDLSAMSYPDFLKSYRAIIKASATLLKNDRFACFVVSEIRDKKGLCKEFVKETITAFTDAGLKLYNEAVLINSCGSLGVRVRAMFNKSRKLGRHHQNILIFVKGDPVTATEAIGPVKLPEEYDEIFEPETTT